MKVQNRGWMFRRYDIETNEVISEVVCNDLKDAYQFALDLKNNNDIKDTLVYSKNHPKGETIIEFLNQEAVIPYEEGFNKINFDVVLDDTPKSTKELEKEPFHNLDEKETREVLKYTDTGFILGELARRLEEYDAFTQTIKKALDHLDINA